MSFAKHFTDGRRENAPAAVDSFGKILNAGYDDTESVQKVALLVWNASLLQWERGTAAGGGSTGSASPMTKRFDKASSSVMYVGSAAVGSAESSSVWGIKKYIFDANGNATAELYAAGSWTNRSSLTYS